PFLGGDTFEAPEFIEIGGKNVEGVYFSTHYSADAPVTPASEKFVAQYKAKFKTAPNTFAALGYDCYNLILDAIERAGSSDPKAIRDAIAKTKGFVGATGIITLDSNGDATKSAVVLVVKDGQFKLVDVVHPR
ncbi:MAG TPA: ABC transporter substrate-binding protein, partial [Bacillota bacterium]|nr:ABC transporter substrate-binding protein [Bacillota bacterium]